MEICANASNYRSSVFCGGKLGTGVYAILYFPIVVVTNAAKMVCMDGSVVYTTKQVTSIIGNNACTGATRYQSLECAVCYGVDVISGDAACTVDCAGDDIYRIYLCVVVSTNASDSTMTV